MGLLSEGNPLSWEETKNLADHVRKHGIIQFINLYKRLRDRQGDVLKWGDEVEYILIKFDDVAKTAKLSLRAAEILKTLNEKEHNDPDNIKSLWRPEYGAYMVEGTPGKPYGGLVVHFNVVEANMRYRRQEASKLLQPNEVLMSLTNFPRTGAPDFTDPPTQPTPNTGVSRSLFFPDEAIYPNHPRFKSLTANIRQRRGEKVAINIPIYKDKNVPSPFKEDFGNLVENKSSSAAKEDHIYMDAMGFGMGCCCLQLTFQACNIEEARTLYDQLTPLCPIMLALTAASPFYRGYISDVDCRWNVISCSVDCRTPAERGLKALKENKFRISKSRYDSIDSYLSEQGEKYNDVPLTYDDEIYNQLLDNGIDKLLAQHIAHLFIRDTVSLFSEKVYQDDQKDIDHFENIQSTNWQTMRFKPPPPNSSIGWRVEFRPCEVQITDFENAAIVCFVVLLTRVILSYNLNLLISISKVDTNMARAQKRNAVTSEKFWFRRDITSNAKMQDDGQPEYTEFTINEIINGKDGVFPGLIPLVNSYLGSMDIDADTHCTIQAYMKLIQKRASGELLTTAAWLRKEVISHPEYKSDSVITQRINYDLLKKIQKITTNEISCPELLGTCILSKTNETIPAAVAKAEKVPL
ncbi:glutamate--cysteine ligase [Ptiloglossa arizonensis]|uniref:glutamate--cysteine ligase n=1 Tax=Ptiloglossa arizonensis TaxID=3350558 RepID=UPI003FA10BFF